MFDISYELYKVFYYVATTLSFSAASKELFISQSAVSQSIKTLELKIGKKLFARSTKQVSLTADGEILLRHVEPAVRLIQKGETQLAETSGAGGQICIGASDTICRYFLVPFLQKFHETFPSIHIKIINQTSLKCVELLDSGQVDLIIANYPNKNISSTAATHKIKTFQDIFVAGEKFSELKNKKISFEQLSNYPILLLERQSTTSAFLHQEFQNQHLDLIPEVELVSNDLLIDLAKIGLGIAFIPDFCLTDKEDRLFEIKTKETVPKRNLIIAYNEHMPIPKQVQAFLDLFEL
ncbi:MAG: LysR family transcriptional regulator [Lachnospiraceae bacterium]|nr:LysR family transcriptional regulator [Lachnospiraceae bacterium]